MERIVECRPAEVLKVLPTAGHAVVSIRGGDYAPLGRMLDDDYLEGAIDAGILSGQEMVLIVGADGRANEHARQLLARHGISSSPAPTTSNALEALVMDFWAIATARSVVMSNSTFCWWAARVGETVTPEQTVTYPAGWVTGDPDHLLSRTLLLPGWRPLASSCVAPAAD